MPDAQLPVEFSTDAAVSCAVVGDATPFGTHGNGDRDIPRACEKSTVRKM